MVDPQTPAAFNERTARPLGKSMSLDGDPAALEAYYAAWADDYDADVGPTAVGAYGLPLSILTTLDVVCEQLPHLSGPDIDVLDAGCGTGRVGMVLAERGYANIDGVDLSPEMVEIARTRKSLSGEPIYRSLEGGVDLTREPVEHRLAAADLVIVGGVFTVGHIPPEALFEVAKLVRPGGALITTVRPGYYDTTEYARASAKLADSEGVDLVAEFDDLPYTADTNGRYFGYAIRAR